jgi:hypothetical protein
MVAVVSHNLRRGKVLDVDDAFGGIWYVVSAEFLSQAIPM